MKKEWIINYEFKKLKFNNGEIVKALNVVNFDSIDIVGKVYPIGIIDTSFYIHFARGIPIKVVDNK